MRVIADIRAHLVSAQELAKHTDELGTRTIAIDNATEARLFPLKVHGVNCVAQLCSVQKD